jgi:hypothetical protein
MLSVVFFVILSVIMLDVVMLSAMKPILVPLLEVESGYHPQTIAWPEKFVKDKHSSLSVMKKKN